MGGRRGDRPCWARGGGGRLSAGHICTHDVVYVLHDLGSLCTELTCFITCRIALVLELISDVLGITLHHWPARGVNYSRAELHYISRPVGELINNSITSPQPFPPPPRRPPLPPPPRIYFFIKAGALPQALFFLVKCVFGVKISFLMKAVFF